MPTEEPRVTALPRVPDLERAVRGQRFGGQYWSSQEYQLRLAVVLGPAERLELQVLADDGDEVARIELPWTVAVELRDALTEALTASGNGPLSTLRERGLHLDREVTWTLCDDIPHNVKLDQGELVEIADWLAYATRQKYWDYAVNGDEWAY